MNSLDPFETSVSATQVHRVCVEREIYSLLDHPFLPTLYTSFQTPTHVCLITDFCPGGELFALLDRQPMKIFREESARFYAAEVVNWPRVSPLPWYVCVSKMQISFWITHFFIIVVNFTGVIYRDLKPENILLQEDGHIVLTDFDLSFLNSFKTPCPTEVITGAGHTSAIDWWALGILLYEMLYGRTPFRGKNRKRTFYNILHKELTFPSSIPVSLAAKQLIHGLLQRDPSSRFGSTAGANDIKQHPFFQDIYWPLIRCMSPPELDVPLELTGKEAQTILKPEEDSIGTF
ncbi:hypothetical protein EJB05_40561, partial [Eragrostis curvula]